MQKNIGYVSYRQGLRLCLDKFKKHTAILTYKNLIWANTALLTHKYQREDERSGQRTRKDHWLTRAVPCHLKEKYHYISIPASPTFIPDWLQRTFSGSLLSILVTKPSTPAYLEHNWEDKELVGSSRSNLSWERETLIASECLCPYPKVVPQNSGGGS